MIFSVLSIYSFVFASFSSYPDFLQSYLKTIMISLPVFWKLGTISIVYFCLERVAFFEKTDQFLKSILELALLALQLSEPSILPALGLCVAQRTPCSWAQVTGVTGRDAFP